MTHWKDYYVKDDKLYFKKTNKLVSTVITSECITIDEVFEISDYEGTTTLTFIDGKLSGKFKQFVQIDSVSKTFLGEFDNGAGTITEYDDENNIISIGNYYLYFFPVGQEKSIPDFYLSMYDKIEIFDNEGNLKKKIKKIHEETISPTEQDWKHYKRYYYYKNNKLEFYETEDYTISRNGEYKSFYKNGNVKCVCDYKNDYRHGFYREYYENSRLKCEGSFRNGVRDGRWVEYHQNGKIKCDGYHIKEIKENEYGDLLIPNKGGVKNGVWKYYDKNGFKIKVECWLKGIQHGYHFRRLEDGTEKHSIYKYNMYIGEYNIITRFRLKISNLF